GALAPRGDAVEPAVQVEVLQGGELAIDERLVREEADARPLDVGDELASRRRREAGADSKEGGLPGTVRAGDEQEAGAWNVELDAAQNAPLAEVLLEPAGANHAATVLRGRARSRTA